jgi:hydroxyacylglutathione hydrolase
MFIQAFPSGPFATNAYLIACPVSKQAAIIDPAPNSAQALLNALQQHNFTCDKILLTHSHWDHIADIAALKAHMNASIGVHALDAPNLEKPGSDGLPFWIPLQGVHPDFFMQEGDAITVGSLIFNVIHTPGHSPGSICLYNREANVLLSGDTLFKGTIGNLSFPTSQPELMWTSLEKLRQLPSQTKVYPGHGPETTIGAESWLPRAKEMFS